MLPRSHHLVALLAALLANPLRAGEVVQHFPGDKPAEQMRTRWRIVWGVERHAGKSEVLVIRAAYFLRGPKEKEVKVLGDCRLAEIFVPYFGGDRVYDVTGHTFNLVTLDRKALGPPCIGGGKLYARNGKEGDKGQVAHEVHDSQVRWMNSRNVVRRGQVLDLWCALDAGNYRYLMLYQFADDGTVSVRLGATAHNMHASRLDRATHVHVGFWRLHIELDGFPKVHLVEFDAFPVGPGRPPTYRNVVTPIVFEDRFKWVPERFTRLRFVNPLVNNRHVPPSPIGYELVPVRMGSARFHGVGEEFTHWDFWVTRSRGMELRARDLPRYLDNEPIGSKVVTVWHCAPVLHVPRDEDFGERGENTGNGVAITSWAGFELKPRNFFGSTPLYP